LIDLIEKLNLRVDKNLSNLLEHHRLIRNLPYAIFLKALTLAQESKTSVDFENTQPNMSNRVMNAVIFKDIPVVSSAKAPFGTDNNMFTGGKIEKCSGIDPLIVSALESGSATPMKTFAQVIGAKDAFRESTISNHELPVCDIPPHLKSTFDPLIMCVDGDDSEVSPTNSVAASNRIAWEEQNEETQSIVSSSRRHFESKSTFKMSEWANHKPIPTTPPPRRSTDQGIIAHDPGITPLPYRPINKAGSGRRKDHCPFATDADNLDVMRKRILMNPLGRISAPHPC